MLPSDLLMQRYQGEEILPRRLPLNTHYLAIATDLIEIFRGAQGMTRGELELQLQILEGEETDYRMKRGLAHLLSQDFSTFEVRSPLDPAELRQRVFALAAPSVPGPQATTTTLATLAETLSRELTRDVSPEQIRVGLYADLPEQQILTSFDTPTPEALIHRYNLAQAQGVLYRASDVVITAHRNDPGEYKLLFRYMKLFGLMSYIEGDADHGFTLTIDGPTSLFKPSTRYGLALAKLLPALLHVSRWSLTATLVPRTLSPYTPQEARFTLDATCGLVGLCGALGAHQNGVASGARSRSDSHSWQCDGARLSPRAPGWSHIFTGDRRLLAPGVFAQEICPGPSCRTQRPDPGDF
jgi:predicted nuclease of restriction endonuclease-like RecB superfamily